MGYTEKEIEFGKALNSWNRVFHWVNNCNEDGLTKVKLLFLLNKILPLIKENPLYEYANNSSLLSDCNNLQNEEHSKLLERIYNDLNHSTTEA